MDIKPVPQFLIQFNALNHGFRGNLVGFADSLVRFQETEAIVKLDGKGVFPLVVADVLEARERPLAKCGFEWIQHFHNLLSVTSCRIISTTFRSEEHTSELQSLR